MTAIIGLAKRAKRLLRTLLSRCTKVYLSPVRRIDRVKTRERVVAITFDDGPCAAACSPDTHGGRALTDVILDTLSEFSARGTFNVVGDTGENYPDSAGAVSTPYWSGTKFDHYPSFGDDANGGAKNQPRIIRRIIDEGHEISSHGYRHIIFGESNRVYSARKNLGSFDAAAEDLRRLHKLMAREYGYTLRLHRPPHYVDRIPDGTTSFDVLASLGYQYLGASYDGCDWLPQSAGYDAEVRHTRAGLDALLARNPDALCGQIIFSMDGFNMALRSPVADGLRGMLEALTAHGYRVVTLSELITLSPLSDLAPGEAGFDKLAWLLARGYTAAFRDNTARMQKPVTRGELIAMFAENAPARRVELIEKDKTARVLPDIPVTHPYSGAVIWAVELGIIPDSAPLGADKPATHALLCKLAANYGAQTAESSAALTRGAAIDTLYELAVAGKIPPALKTGE
ncbi:MAG: polysaccharide deacetylase family protein [Oscillospiraceae bacterium]|jgi:peptidoglycan/xylan/chitin deacetylase (PgdA/CDA1 family)|nr:polysaccharide deacetylase family protein [Oscillospiraceae bacterium]